MHIEIDAGVRVPTPVIPEIRLESCPISIALERQPEPFLDEFASAFLVLILDRDRRQDHDIGGALNACNSQCPGADIDREFSQSCRVKRQITHFRVVLRAGLRQANGEHCHNNKTAHHLLLRAIVLITDTS